MQAHTKLHFVLLVFKQDQKDDFNPLYYLPAVVWAVAIVAKMANTAIDKRSEGIICIFSMVEDFFYLFTNE